ncbi:ABC transporter permease [Acidisoma cellulosilytica]|uniref:ABC transporter permease n=1 Tax=Acidisoma cellulosilyticum TaxID=2802395 RepID=A0A964E4L9_9PROT|nr:ABC transporter permease [Acidisoma cellulosilyticum]MCB8881402.1 ABC transporter permease [Acidisoma cellulosilyticum]
MIYRYILRRLGISVLQLLGLVIAVFFLIRMLPADPVARLVGMNASPAAYAQAAHSLGLDQPILIQFLRYFGLGHPAHGLLEGYLGVSWVTNTPVLTEMGQMLPVTFQLLGLSFLVTLLIAVPVGIISARRPGGIVDKAVFAYGLFGGSQPEFWWGLLFVFVFFFKLGVAPAPLGLVDPMLDSPPTITGFILIDSLITGEFDVFVDVLYHLMLPVLTLVFILSGPIMKMVRQNMIRALQSDFILYGQAAGLSQGMITRYAFRAALAPSMTLVGILFGVMLGGAVLVESVFSLGGIGQYAVRSVLAFDYPAIQGVVLVITGLSLIIYLVLDILYAAIDPRVTHS